MSGIDKNKLKVRTAKELKKELKNQVEVHESISLVGKTTPKKKQKKKQTKQKRSIAEIPTSPSASSVAPKTEAEFWSSIKPEPEYVKHLVECQCFLPQFRKMEDPVLHKFIVFSELDDLGNLKRSYAKCNNCGIVHRILEVGKSEILQKEDSKFLQNKNDIRSNLPEWTVKLLEEYECEIHVWQEAQWILKNKTWGRFVVLTKERDENIVLGKACLILGENLYKVESFERDDGFIQLPV